MYCSNLSFQICNYENLTSKQQMNIPHKKNNMSVKTSVKLFICRLCCKNFPSSCKLSTHMLLHRKITLQSGDCQICKLRSNGKDQGPRYHECVLKLAGCHSRLQCKDTNEVHFVEPPDDEELVNCNASKEVDLLDGSTSIVKNEEPQSDGPESLPILSWDEKDSSGPERLSKYINCTLCNRILHSVSAKICHMLTYHKVEFEKAFEPPPCFPPDDY